MAQVTRLGLSATPRGLIGPFEDKTEDIVDRLVILEAKIKDLEDLYYLNLILP